MLPSYKDVLLRGGGSGNMERPKRAAAAKAQDLLSSPKKNPQPTQKSLQLVDKFELPPIPDHVEQEEAFEVVKQRKVMCEALKKAELAEKPKANGEKGEERGSLRVAYSYQNCADPIKVDDRGYITPSVGMASTLCNQVGHSFKKLFPKKSKLCITLDKSEFETLWCVLKDGYAHNVYKAFPNLRIKTAEMRIDGKTRQDDTANEVLLDRGGSIAGGLEGFRAVATKPDGDCALHALALGLLGEKNGGPLLR